MILIDKANNVNNSIKMTDIVSDGGGHTSCIQVLTTGTVAAGTPKLTVSQDNENFYPLKDENGDQVELTPEVPVYLDFANLYIKCDLTGVTSDDLKVSVQ